MVGPVLRLANHDKGVAVFEMRRIGMGLSIPSIFSQLSKPSIRGGCDFAKGPAPWEPTAPVGLGSTLK